MYSEFFSPFYFMQNKNKMQLNIFWTRLHTYTPAIRTVKTCLSNGTQYAATNTNNTNVHLNAKIQKPKKKKLELMKTQKSTETDILKIINFWILICSLIFMCAFDTVFTLEIWFLYQIFQFIYQMFKLFFMQSSNSFESHSFNFCYSSLLLWFLHHAKSWFTTTSMRRQMKYPQSCPLPSNRSDAHVQSRWQRQLSM